ncbi:MAG: substrate-binding domain-containing protein [Akkermansiaceae bacterium]|nr:substrate-binding domain-containing protein [Akkermansiaceae bacterium]
MGRVAVAAMGTVLAGCGGGNEAEVQTAGKFTILGTQTDNADRSIAKKNAENTLVKYPDIDAMVGLWAYNAPQCLEALKDADKLGKVKVFSFDEDPAALEAIKDGSCEGTVVQNPFQFGYQAMKYLKEMVVDQKTHELPEDKQISIPARTITKENVEAFQAELAANLKAGEEGKNAARPADAPKFAFITNVADPFWSHAEAGCYKAEKDFGIVADFEMNSAGDVAGQNKILENILNKGDYKGIALSVLNPANQTGLINETAAKLPLITHDSDAPESDRLFYLGTNNVEAGRRLGKLVKERMPDGGKIMIFVGKIDQLNAQQRRQGLIEELSAE